MANLDITNVVQVSVSTPPAGLANYAVNNLLILTKDTPINGSLGSFTVYVSAAAVASDWGTTSETYAQANAVFSQQPNILGAGGSLIIAAFQGGETLTQAINRLLPLTFFLGILYAGYSPSDVEVEAAATAVQPLNRMLFASSYLTTTATSGGLAFTVQAATLTRTRVLLYTVGVLQARIMAAAYAGRALSTDFTGSLTTQTMHMKPLVGILPDPGITQTILVECEAAGCDVYADIGGLPKVFCTGGNDFFDNQYNQLWLIYALQVAGFNALATTNTKIPQTEVGMATLQGAYQDVLQQAVVNGYVAPGAWNSPEVFGNPADLIRNIADVGYYLYHQPVAQQSQANRVARQAPLIQAAIKLAGAIQSTSLVVNINP